MLRNAEVSPELLLTPVGDAAADLSSALIALHKIGQAACRELAKTSIPDEFALGQAIESTASARGAVSKAIGVALGDAHLGELIVRDAVADAAHASLDLFRRLRSKDVPAAVAVERVGMVYGVPSNELAAFGRTASELRAHPAALADSADRAVFGHVAKVAALEVETVAKALTTIERSALVETQRRGPDGRWATNNATRTKASFATKIKAVAPVVAEPKVRTVRRVKTVRQIAAAPTAVATASSVAPKAKLASARPSAKISMQRATLPSSIKAATVAPAELPFDSPVMKLRVPGQQEDYYPAITEEAYVLLAPDVYASFDQRLESQRLIDKSKDRHFRIGHLMEMVPGGEALPMTADGLYTDSMIEAHEVALQVTGLPEVAHHEEIDAGDPIVAGMSERQAMNTIRSLYGHDIVMEWAKASGISMSDDDIEQAVFGVNSGLVISSHHDPSGRTQGYDVVYVPPDADLPVVYELMIESGYGELTGTPSSKQRSWSLFPDSVYRMRKSNDVETVMLRDADGSYLRAVFVQRIELVHTTEEEYREARGSDVGKALAGAELAVFEARVQRDTKGRFSESKASFAQFRPQSATATQASTVARTTRKVKTVRSTAPAATRSEVLAAPAAKLVLARPEAKASAQAQTVAQMVAAKIATKPEPERKDPFLAIKYDRQHKVLDRTDFAKAAKFRHLQRDIFPVDEDIVYYLRRSSVGETVHNDIAAMVATQMAASMSEVTMDVEVYAPRADPYSNPELEARMIEFLDSDERIVGIREDPTWNPPSGREHFHRLLKVNSGEPLHLIEIDDGIKYDKPMEMVRLHEGYVRYRTDLLANTDLERGVSAVNPYMEKWLLRNV